MVPKFENDWLLDVVRSGTPLEDALYSLWPEDFIHAVRKIQDFQGTKVMLSCTDRTPLVEVVKQALFFADLVIIVPAPLWVSCMDVGAQPLAEFNYESTGLASASHFSPGLLRNLSRLFATEAWVIDCGAVTFLPVLGESQHRWSHPALGFGELSVPLSEDESLYSLPGGPIDAVYGLRSERLSAERLGSMHLNSASFTKAVFGDLAIGKQQNGKWVHYLCEVSVPDLSLFSLNDVARMRCLPEASQVSRAAARVLSPGNPDNGVIGAMFEDLQNSAASFTQRVALTLAPIGTDNHMPKTTVVFGSGGPQGSLSTITDFIQSGGTLRDLVRLITVSGEKRLELGKDSFWAAYF